MVNNMTESFITTRIKVVVDKTGLDSLPSDGIFSPLKDIVDDISNRLDESAENIGDASANQLLQYEELYYNEHTHPYETGVGRDSFYTETTSNLEWLVDNSAENNGFPYLVTDELGDNPGRVLEPHPFAEPGREALITDLDSMWVEVSTL